MKLFRTFLIVALAITPLSGFTAEQLRVFIRAGAKTHGPGAHDHPKFLAEWTKLLNERGVKASGALEFPTKEQLEQTDVLILHAERAGNIKIGEERKNLEAFLKRGGGLVVLHAGAVADDSNYYKNIIGGSWKNGTTKWLEAPMSLYFTDRENPITQEASNFDLDDEIYYDMDVQDDVHVLASAFTPKPLGRDKRAQERAEQLTGGGKKVSVYDIQPQMWTYERRIEGGEPYRAFVSIPGHYYKNFELPNYRAILLRGIAWAGKLKNVDQLCSKEELADLRYPVGGPTHPDKALTKLEVHPEFNMKLVASEPLINKVLNLDWDEKGRMWVCETPEYPNGLRELNVERWKDTGSLSKKDREPQDRISILTDTNGDGVMDSKKVFADKIELVTSFVLHRNGVIASAAPDIWFFEDTDGDEVADKRTKIYTGLGDNDSHAVINNLRWGYDGWIYATVGYSAGHPKSPDGSVDFGPITAGVVRFKPDGSAFEQFSSKNSNTWGLNITSNGQAFFTQPTCGDVLMHVVLPENILSKGKVPGSNSYNVLIKGEKTFPLMKWEQQAYVQIDQVGAYTAASGCAIYEGGTWPEKWNYSYFTGEPTINILSHRFVTPDGVTYKSEREKGREQTEFIRSSDLWFRPVENRVGPDGALYVVDFYNQAVIHNDTRGPIHGPANAAVRPDRDHYFARVWRVDHKEAKKLEAPTLDRKNLAQLWNTYQKTPNAHIKSNAWRLLREAVSANPDNAEIEEFAKLVRKIESQRSATTKPMELYAQASKVEDNNGRANLLSRYTKSEDDWSKSAIIAAADKEPMAFIAQALKHPQADQLVQFVQALLSNHINSSPEFVNALVINLANQSNANALLVNATLRSTYEQSQNLPALNQDTSAALRKLLSQENTAEAALPLAAKWDKDLTLKDVLQSEVTKLFGVLSNAQASDETRLAAVKSLLGARHVDEKILPEVSKALASAKDNAALQRELITALGSTADLRASDALIATYPNLSADLQRLSFDQLIKRAESTDKFLKAIEAGNVKVSSVGPTDLARLRTHPAKNVANFANRLLDRLTNPSIKEKEALIAKLTEEVKKPGNIANGKVIFSSACAICHVLGDEGKNVGPILTGMGAHGPEELLGHIVDPNREVDPSFWAINITKKNGETLVGVIAQENSATVLLRNQAGEFEIRKDDIAKRENTRRSLMPEGFEAFGAENLRDMLAYMTQADTRFRIVDLKKSFTSDSRIGLFHRLENKNENLNFTKFGNVIVEDVPFFLVDPAKSLNGANVIVLKGGPAGAYSKTLPQQIEVPVGFNAKSLHLLGAVAGWGYPAVKEPVVAVRVTIKYADGKEEKFDLKNGIHYADYIREVEVPGSKLTKDLVSNGQLRYLSLPVNHDSEVKSLLLESLDNTVAPVIVAITADQRPEGKFPWKKDLQATSAPAKQDPNLMPGPEKITWDHSKKKALIVAGGTSHDFRAWFEVKDKEILEKAGFSVNFTENASQAAEEIKNVDVVIVSVNRPFFDTLSWRKALFDHANAGKGIIMFHPGTWYGYAKWPELNAQIVGGGSRGHDKIGEFSIHVLKKDHPVTRGVNPSFKVVDELYYMNAEEPPAGTIDIEVLAETSPSQKYGRPHPNIWIAKHPQARVVGMALGHDGRVHEHPDFQKLLINATRWAAGK